jgi:hypothetical protein
MQLLKLLSFLVILLLGFSSFAQVNKKDSLFIRSIFDEALMNGKSYEDLRSLCKDIGARLSGSAEAAMAVEWSKRKMESYGFDNVYLQEVMVPHWERGTREAGWYKGKDEKLTKISVLALGGSIGTNGLMTGELVLFNTREELLNAKRKDVEGKIVFLNQPMDNKLITTFNAYGGCYPIRGYSAIDASKLGAKAVIIRSLSLSNHEHPHTGTMQYEDGVEKIPAAAISTKDADILAEFIKSEKKHASFILEMNCRKLEDKLSYNVIGEMTGKTNPDEIISFGGHLDSWDVGEGAHDDGAGVIHSMEALRILKELKYQPKRTLRVVFFMNEENGNMGGKTYAKQAKLKGEKHLAAVESDRGGFSPRGFSCDGEQKHIDLIQGFTEILKPYELHKFEKGYGGVDIGPLKDEFEGIPLFGFVPDSQRYFDFHHNANDVFENVNKRELELGAASMASFIYLLDKNL